jgi:hypothetical protein
MWNQLISNRAKDLVYIYVNNKLLQECLSANPMPWYKKNMLFEYLMSDVDEMKTKVIHQAKTL